jgi:hypothetical protein
LGIGNFFINPKPGDDVVKPAAKHNGEFGTQAGKFPKPRVGGLRNGVGRNLHVSILPESSDVQRNISI